MYVDQVFYRHSSTFHAALVLAAFARRTHCIPSAAAFALLFVAPVRQQGIVVAESVRTVWVVFTLAAAFLVTVAQKALLIAQARFTHVPTVKTPGYPRPINARAKLQGRAVRVEYAVSALTVAAALRHTLAVTHATAARKFPVCTQGRNWRPIVDHAKLKSPAVRVDLTRHAAPPAAVARRAVAVHLARRARFI